jgi:ABC-type Na+ efflux pump permease subunit
MNSQDVTRALKSGSFIFWMLALVFASLFIGSIAGMVDTAEHAATPGTAATALVAWVSTFFLLGMARGTSISSFAEDKFSGMLETSLVRPVSRAGLVFGRFIGVVLGVLIAAVVAAVLVSSAYTYSHRGTAFPQLATIDLAIGLAIAGIVMAALCFLLTYATASASGARWATRGINWLLFVVFALGVSLANIPALLVANPLLLPLTLTSGAVPYSVPSGGAALLFGPLQATRIGGPALIGIGIGWIAATVVGLLAKVRSTD